jgi:hypothetical protein
MVDVKIAAFLANRYDICGKESLGEEDDEL